MKTTTKQAKATAKRNPRAPRAIKLSDKDIEVVLDMANIDPAKIYRAHKRMHEVVWSGEIKFKFAAEYVAQDHRLNRDEKAELCLIRDRMTEAQLLAQWR